MQGFGVYFPINIFKLYIIFCNSSEDTSASIVANRSFLAMLRNDPPEVPVYTLSIFSQNIIISAGLHH